MTGAIAAAALLAPASAQATPFNYGFDADNQGWEITQNNGMSNTFTYINSQGNPGGFIFDADEVAETGCPAGKSCLEEFFSPGVPAGSLAGSYGGTLSFDLKTTNNLAITHPARLIVSPPGATAQALIRDVPITASTVAVPWQRYTTPLTEAGWFYCPANSSTCSPATQAEFKGVLGVATFTDIVADLVRPTATGTVGLDNVVITDPPPASPVVPAKKKKKCTKKKKKKRFAATAKKKKCKKKQKKKLSVFAGETRGGHLADPGALRLIG